MVNIKLLTIRKARSFLLTDRFIGITISVIAFFWGLYVQSYHELWRDEANTLLILRNSESLSTLVSELAGHGFPIGFFVFVWPFKFLTSEIFNLRAGVLLFSLFSCLCFALSCRFSALQKVMLPFGFFVLYQYGVIIKNYSLLIAILFFYNLIREISPRHLAIRFIILSFIPLCHPFGFIFVLLMLAIEAGDLVGERFLINKQCLLRVTILGIGGMLGILLMKISMISTTSIGLEKANLMSLLIVPINAFAPIYGDLVVSPVDLILGYSLWLLSWSILMSNRRAIILYLILHILLALGFSFIYVGYRWHHAFLLFGFITIFWNTLGLSPRENRLAGLVLSLILLTQLIKGISACTTDIQLPYSGGKAIAEIIGRHGSDAMLLSVINVSANDRCRWDYDAAQSITVYLSGGKVFDPESSEYKYFQKNYLMNYVWFSCSEICSKLQDVYRTQRKPIFLVSIPFVDSKDIYECPNLIKVGIYSAFGDHGESFDLHHYYPL